MPWHTLTWMPLVWVCYWGSPITCCSQSGYVWLIGEDSVRRGEVREVYQIEGEGRGVEIMRWNKKREKYSFRRVQEFATKRDTFRVFNELQLDHRKSTWMEVALGKPICLGRLNLYSLRSPWEMRDSFWGPVSEVLILVDPDTLEVRPLVGNVLTVLEDFIPRNEIDQFLRRFNGKVKYKDVGALICEFNTRQRR